MSSAAMNLGFGTSQRKQELYSKYATGELTLAQVSKQISEIVPARRSGAPRLIASIVVAVLGAFLLPRAYRRDD